MKRNMGAVDVGIGHDDDLVVAKVILHERPPSHIPKLQSCRTALDWRAFCRQWLWQHLKSFRAVAGRLGLTVPRLLADPSGVTSTISNWCLAGGSGTIRKLTGKAKFSGCGLAFCLLCARRFKRISARSMTL